MPQHHVGATLSQFVKGSSLLALSNILSPPPALVASNVSSIILEAKGDFTDHEYEFWRQSGLRATVSKQWFAWSDTCGVEIAEGEDDLLILASTVVIDLACQADQQRR